MRFSDLAGRRIGLWGAGREAASVVRAIRAHLPSTRIEVAVTDAPASPEETAALGLGPGATQSGPDAWRALLDCDVVVRSPGISIYRPDVDGVRSAGVPITSATDLWLGEAGDRSVVAVTGTKGKSTTAALLAHLVGAAGASVELAGNIGRPVLDLLDSPAPDHTVLELSSYQTSDLSSGPRVAVFTNLSPEHLDWHRTHEAYFADKLRLATLPGVRVVVVNGRDERLKGLAGTELRRFGAGAGWDVTPTHVVHGGRPVVARDDLPLLGEHNALNLCAALAALEALGLEAPADLAAALRGFRALPHRLEPVHDEDGVGWIDDSISTTPESTLAALRSYPDSAVVLIGGGSDRGQDHRLLAAELAARPQPVAVVGLPATGGDLVAAAVAAGVPADRTALVADLPEAVRRARELARPPGLVLLSPAAPSYLQYRDFAARGDHFAALARRCAAH